MAFPITAKILESFDDLWIGGGLLHDLNHDCLRLVTNHCVANAEWRLESLSGLPTILVSSLLRIEGDRRTSAGP